ncbi:hypothetical protein BH10PSE17_BH10PSE17_29620 [soil metagenome]
MGAAEANLAPLDFFQIDWPESPIAGLDPDTSACAAGASRVELAQGTSVSGQIVEFSAGANQLKFKVPLVLAPLTMQFSVLKAVHLLAPLRAGNPTGRAADELAAARPRRYTVRYRDQTVLTGETLTPFIDARGTFLFSPSGTQSLQRVFIPASAADLVEIESETVAAANPTVPDVSFDFSADWHIGTADALWAAIAGQEHRPMVRLGEVLVERGLISQSQLNNALDQQSRNKGKPLGKILLEAGLIDEESLKIALAGKLGTPIVSLDQFKPDPRAVQLVPLNMAQRHHVLPLAERDGMLVVAMEDAWRSDTVDELKFLTQRKIYPALVPLKSVQKNLKRFYGATLAPAEEKALEFEPSDVNELAQRLATEEHEDDAPQQEINESDNALTRLVNTMITDAYSQGASDIHIETYPGKASTVIRFRKDGDLGHYLDLPSKYRRAIIARIKIMASLDISERRKPQDGKIDFQKFGPLKIELRVATIPTTTFLEDSVMRILASAKPVPLEKLGLSKHNADEVRRITARPYGMFLVCGPTGSGKTTTLHSCLAHINTPERKIWTAEDPVEITQQGLRQVQVNAKIGWTFADALRAFLRADPDVVMIGEMRDGETSRIAVEASLTGHLVMSTLHTNSAPESITRLLDMGLDPFNFGDAILGVLAQRLVRRLCTACRTSKPASDEFVTELIDDYARYYTKEAPADRKQLLADWTERFGEKGQLRMFHCAGCEVCGGTGFKGRAGLHELLSANKEVKRLIQTGGRVEELQDAAISNGMRTLRQDGIEKILQGITNLVEVRSASN